MLDLKKFETFCSPLQYRSALFVSFVNGYERIVSGLWMDCKRLWMDLHSVVLYRNFAPSSTDIITVSNWQGEAVSTSKTFKAMKQNRSPTKSAERRQNNSITYRSRIVSVSISYQSRIVLVSFSYRSPIILASGSGDNTETIRKPQDKQGRNKGECSQLKTFSNF